MSICGFPFVVVMYDHRYLRSTNIMDPHWIAIAPRPAGELARSAMPDAPVAAERGRRARRRARGFAGRVAARFAATRLEKEQPCGI
jgi:4'-phosphopantetheinyl transferase EntD